MRPMWGRSVRAASAAVVAVALAGIAASIAFAVPPAPAAAAPPRPTARCSRPPTCGTSASTGCRCRQLGTLMRTIGLNAAAPGLRLLRRLRHPVQRGRDPAASAHGAVPLRRRVRHGPYPIPAARRSRRGSDRHILMVDTAQCRLYELFDARQRRPAGAPAPARSGTLTRTRCGRRLDERRCRRPADPARPGPLRRGQGRRDQPRAALHRAATRCSAHIYPARHDAGRRLVRDAAADGPARAAQGVVRHVRLRAPSRGSSCRRCKRYGMILADNGSAWYISGAPTRSGTTTTLHQLNELHGRDFEVVDTSTLRNG